MRIKSGKRNVFADHLSSSLMCRLSKTIYICSRYRPGCISRVTHFCPTHFNHMQIRQFLRKLGQFLQDTEAVLLTLHRSYIGV